MFRLLCYCLVVLVLFGLTTALYVDQIGKFDWKKQLIGKVTNVTKPVNCNDVVRAKPSYLKEKRSK